MVPGCGNRPLRAAGVLPTLCSLCEPNSRNPYAGTRFPSTPPANYGEPCQSSQTPPIQIPGWVTQGDQQHPATFSFHLMLCTVYTIAKHTEILHLISDFTATLCTILLQSTATSICPLPLNLCYLPPSMQVHLLMHNV